MWAVVAKSFLFPILVTLANNQPPCLPDHLKLNIIIPSLARAGNSISWPCANEYSRLVLLLSSVHGGVIWDDDLYASPHANISIT